MKKEFDVFKEEFNKWYEKLGLYEWKIYFQYEPIEDCFADIIWNIDDKVATVRLNSDDCGKLRDVKQCAKHEVLHLLIAKLQSLGKDRFAMETAFYEETEGIVHKLEKFIQ
jgi:hypothetical protein